MFKKIATFFTDVRQEMAKVSWPSRDELKDSTVITILVTLFFAVFIYGIDKIIGGLVRVIYNY
jgi:preprotein translocase subunit SecE